MLLFAIVTCALLAVLTAIVAQTVWIELRSLRPARAAVALADPRFAGLAVHPVSLQTEDGVTLRGWFIPSGNGAAVALFHGYAGNRQQLAREGAALARAGYGVLLLDARAHGESGGERSTFGDTERYDVRAAVDFLVARSARIGLLGFSAGASAVALVAAEDPRVNAVVLEAPTTSIREFARDESGRLAFLRAPVIVATLRWAGIDVDAVAPVNVVGKIAPRPLLVVHGSDDRIIPVTRGRAVYDAAAEPKRLLLVEGGGHGGYESVDPTYLDTLLTFLDGQLRTPPIPVDRAQSP